MLDEKVLALSLQGAATISSDAFICLFHRCFKLSVNFISFLQMATYMKSLARRAGLAEGSVKTMKSSRAKVASLTSENADLRARVQRLSEDVVKYKSNLKHTTTMKARVEDKEKKSLGELRVVKDALWAVRDELQVARDELHVVQDKLHVKATTVSRVIQEASEAVSSVERLTEECHGLRGDLQRQKALVSQKKGVIVELRARLVPCGPPGGSPFVARLLRFSWVWISTSKFLQRGRWKNMTLTMKRTSWYSQMPLALFLSLVDMWLRLLRRPTLLPRLLVLHPLTYMLLRALIGCSVRTSMVWAWKHGRSLLAVVTNARTSFSIFGYLSSAHLKARLQ